MDCYRDVKRVSKQKVFIKQGIPFLECRNVETSADFTGAWSKKR